MKKLLSILVALSMVLGMATMVSAATADIVHQSVEGTATIDGVKDDAYASGLILPMVQKGVNNGGNEVLAEPVGNAYVLNDATYVYWFVEVYDTTLDNTSANTYEQDSVELFYMADNSKVQLRFCYDGNVGADTGAVPAAEDYVITVEEGVGYTLEYRMPITDVKANQIETCVQINYCADGVRSHTTYIEGNGDADNAYQRTTRQADYDVWWTLTLAGEFEDNRVDPEEKPMELTPSNYTDVQNNSLYVQLYTQRRTDWGGWASVGSGAATTWNTSVDYNWTDLKMLINYDNTHTDEYTVDPVFSMQIGDNGWLKLPENAEVGTTGDSAKYHITYTDIIITADGYADVVVPAGEINTTWTVKQESGYTSGNSSAIDLVTPIKNQLGLDTAGLCEYLKNLTSVSTNITYVSYNLVDAAVMDQYLIDLDAEDEAVKVTLQEYVDRVNAALESANAANGDVAVLEEAADEAQKATNRAIKEAEGYTKSTELATSLQATVDQISAMLEEAKAAAEAPVEDEPVDAPVEDEPADAPVEDEPTTEGGSSTGLIIGIVAVVVIIVVVVIILLGKKKK